jgi:hypothetical protein
MFGKGRPDLLNKNGILYRNNIPERDLKILGTVGSVNVRPEKANQKGCGAERQRLASGEFSHVLTPLDEQFEDH